MSDGPGILPPTKIGGLSYLPPATIGGQAVLQRHASGQIPGGRRVPPAIPSGSLQEISNLNQWDMFARTWKRWRCDRPTILYPIVSEVNPVEARATLAGAQAEIYYIPNYAPDINTTTPEQLLKVAQVSVGCGIVYLPHAGDWSLFWNAQNSLSLLHWLAIDASDPAVAARYQFENGIHGISTNTTVATTAVDQICLASNRLRKGFLIAIDNTAVTNTCRLGFNAAANPGAGVKLGVANEPTTFGMSGENCFKGNVHVITATGSVGDTTISVLEWF